MSARDVFKNVFAGGVFGFAAAVMTNYVKKNWKKWFGGKEQQNSAVDKPDSPAAEKKTNGDLVAAVQTSDEPVNKAKMNANFPRDLFEELLNKRAIDLDFIDQDLFKRTDPAVFVRMSRKYPDQVDFLFELPKDLYIQKEDDNSSEDSRRVFSSGSYNGGKKKFSRFPRISDFISAFRGRISDPGILSEMKDLLILYGFDLWVRQEGYLVITADQDDDKCEYLYEIDRNEYRPHRGKTEDETTEEDKRPTLEEYINIALGNVPGKIISLNGEGLENIKVVDSIYALRVSFRINHPKGLTLDGAVRLIQYVFQDMVITDQRGKRFEYNQFAAIDPEDESYGDLNVYGFDEVRNENFEVIKFPLLDASVLK